LMRKRRVEVYETNDVNIKVNKRMFKMMWFDFFSIIFSLGY
jgi:hypothetical protein